MTTRTWNGASGSFADGSQWTPTGAPVSGDTAIISAGTVLASGLTLSGLTITLLAAGSSGGTFYLTNDTIAANTVVTANNTTTYGSGTNDYLNIQGTTTNLGALNFFGSITFMQMNGTLINSGTMSIVDASLIVQAASGAGTPTIQNNGTIYVSRPDSVYQSPVIGANITGTGLINVSANAKIDFSQGVGSGQALSFTGGVNASSVVQVDSPANFNPNIIGFAQGDTITVTNTPYTNFTYTSSGASSGTLALFNGTTQVGALTLTGVYSASTFSLTYQALGGGGSNLVITTSVINPTTGQTSGGGSSGLGVYRFYDPYFGTHLFTQSLAEAQNIIATGAEGLQEETNDFGAVASTSPAAEPVYRFFELHNGTHFYTASTVERDNLIQNDSSNLSYEPSSTFYEDSTQQTGDVAVVRFFDQITGTQFLTGSSAEVALVSNPANTPGHIYQNEGTAFYAPAGTFRA